MRPTGTKKPSKKHAREQLEAQGHRCFYCQLPFGSIVSRNGCRQYPGRLGVVKKTRGHLFSIALMIVLSLSVAFGCATKKNRVQTLPEPPQRAAIESAIQDYENHKENNDISIPISEYRDCLRMLAKTWGNYEYARKELAKAAVEIDKIRTIAAVDLEVMEGQVQKAQAERDKHRRHFWYAVGAGVVATALGFLIGAVAF